MLIIFPYSSLIASGNWESVISKSTSSNAAKFALEDTLNLELSIKAIDFLLFQYDSF